MAGSLATLVDFMRDDGRLVLVLSDQRPAMVEALLLAADQARLGVMSLVQCRRDYRLELAPSLPEPDALPSAASITEDPLHVRLRRAVVHIAVETIRERGEPVLWPKLHAEIYEKLAQAGLLGEVAAGEDGGASTLDQVAEQVEVALDNAAFTRLTASESRGELWWLARAEGVERPLCDRVETEARKVLEGALAVTEEGYAAQVYARFPGALTPDAELVAACLRSYGSEPTPGYWQLRPEDLPESRLAEQRVIIDQLLLLGRRLGYRAEPSDPFDLTWREKGQVWAVFSVHWQAMVGDAVALSQRAAGARPYLVIPGGRAALVSYKLAHNPVWQQAIDDYGWWFIKYRHVRELLEQPEIDEYTLRTIVGLDPIVERESAQLPLF
jgi:hypothetical protein